MPSQLLTIYDCHGQKCCPILEEINHKSNNYDGNDVHMENTPPLEGERKTWKIFNIPLREKE